MLGGGTNPVAAQSKFQGQSRIFQSAAVREKRRRSRQGTGRRCPEQILGTEECGQGKLFLSSTKAHGVLLPHKDLRADRSARSCSHGLPPLVGVSQ